MARLFGTDGVRGKAGSDLTPELALSLGRAAVSALGGKGRPTIVVGRDTRLSGGMLQAALSAGVTSAGGDVVRLGVVPTPAVAFLSTSLGADAGVVISASHNPPEDNGIKFFSREGMKLPDDVEEEMERLVTSGDGPRATGLEVGLVTDRPEAGSGYVKHVVDGAGGRLEGMRLVVDCAFGAAYRVGPEILRALGAEVQPLHDSPDGARINVGCGATHPQVVAEEVVRVGADAGVAFDGDADRAILCDERGEIIDGDQILVACATAMKEEGALAKDSVVVTVMANLGLRRAMADAGIEVLETAVGDRNVLEELLRSGAVLGGEQSGHVVFLDHATTGDGILTAARFLALCGRSGRAASDLASTMRRYPQVLENVRVSGTWDLETSPRVAKALSSAQRDLAGRGRVLVRPSGTEPLVRVMVEADTEEEARRHALALAEAIRSALG